MAPERRDTVAPAPEAPGPKAVVRTRIKICGITKLEDAEFAVEAGAWAIGLILNAWDVYLRAPITEAEVQREMDRLNAPR